MVKRLAAGILIGLALSPSAASANTWGSAAERAQPYTTYAQQFWEKRGGFIACPMGVEVTWWDWGLGEAGAANGGNGLGGCHLWLSPDAWRELSPGWRCHVLLHEWGHLIGLDHASSPRDVMYPEPVRQHPSCRRFNRG